ncbi:hypothetical protein ASPZODRAFT_128428 [Penicilliopsis zonata CBS 506.65]|uniref:Uncharacterized protein n=1 Tax=Penicilliopsis zonata CBS 506.65 TaxID=1073090 RepID=A0A1L9SRX0_9EURO|nr:hypothetical protein ASPZODRAFT_128428 [Penicilliopsis zonata CBS 506.65]OJJ49873.1 hypothetical protein ASPZODRAFT_128428 [Penicilliopsis zonata CBS 506.65]
MAVPTDIQPKDKTNAEFLRDSGFESMDQFMIAYGLKPHDAEECEEARLIFEDIKDGAQVAWEREHGIGADEEGIIQACLEASQRIRWDEFVFEEERRDEIEEPRGRWREEIDGDVGVEIVGGSSQMIWEDDTDEEVLSDGFY